MALVLACTLTQASLGLYEAVRFYIRSPFLYAYFGDWKVPLFPGGASVGLILLANLAAAQFARLELSWRKAGLWAVHFGLVFLFIGEYVTGMFQVETQLAIEEGATLNYSEDPRRLELAVIDETDPGYDQIYSIPQGLLRPGKTLAPPQLPFAVRIERCSPPVLNADGMVAGPGAVEIDIWGADPVMSLASDAQARSFSRGKRRYRAALRLKRHYLPLSLTLKDFRHEIYPGTDIPSHFSSLVTLSNPSLGERRNVLISMNEPLRYGGKAFYQSSFGKEGTLSVLQVVENPGWLLPYLSCALMGLGLLAHFLRRLRGSVSGAR